MMKVMTVGLCLLMLSSSVKGQANYDVGLISKDLLPYASVVVRNEEVTIEVKDLNNTIYHIKKAVTVLNKNGDEIAQIAIWHNKSNIIKYIKGSFYNEFGTLSGKFSESDFDDVSSVQNFSLFEDSKVNTIRRQLTVTLIL
jgi:hypothetical protein